MLGARRHECGVPFVQRDRRAFDVEHAGALEHDVDLVVGVRLLPELTAHLNPMRGWEALEIEAGLAEELRRAGVPWVEGGH